MIKYAFFGTPGFAALILEKLINAGLPPALVICNPDRPAGKKQIITPPPTKILAERYKITVLQPETLNTEIFKHVQNLDFAVVAAYAKIIPKEIIELPRLGTIGVHPSLLPKYRGATPIQSVILNGEKETGTTLFLLDTKVDHGQVLEKRIQPITDSDNYETLLKKLAEISTDLLIEILPKFIKGEIKPQSQNEKEATYTKKFRTEDGYLDIEKDDPIKMARKIRALNPEPGTWTIRQVHGKQQRIKILDERTVQFDGKKPRHVDNAINFLKSL